MDAQGRRIAAQGAATTLVIDDIEVQISGAAQDGDQIQIGMRANVADSMYVAFTDVRKLAAARLFNIQPAAEDVGNARAQVSLLAEAASATPQR